MKHYSHRILSPFLGKIIVTFLIIIMSIGICRAQSAGLKIHYLGANHSLVQVQELQKYLLLPVEEAAPDGGRRGLHGLRHARYERGGNDGESVGSGARTQGHYPFDVRG